MWYLICVEHRARATREEFERFSSALRLIGGVQVFWEAWGLKSDRSSEQLCQYLRTWLNADDRLLIVELMENASSHNLIVQKRTQRWIEEARTLEL